MGKFFLLFILTGFVRFKWKMGTECFINIKKTES